MAVQKTEKREFQTEVKQLMQLMIHSLYSNKEIVLRELISNASDAADKLRFEALANSALYENDSELKITVSFDKAKRTVTISDNGIGMSRDEVIANIGTIAKSGTKEFMQKIAADEAQASSGVESQAANLIGQFGVGFYSAFIIADKVTLTSRRAGSKEAVKWISAGEGDYTLETTEKPSRGTEIILHLRKDEDEFLNDWQLKSIIRKYSDHITLPIMMHKSEWKEGAEGQPGEMVTTDEWEAVNKANALWARAKSDITVEDYNEFYKHVSHDYETPLAYSHSRVEGKQEYISLLYIPAKAPFDLYDRERRHGIKLYVKRVFIMEDAEKLMPQYLRFVRGVIDSADLPLNVSREILQDSRDVDAIKNGSVKKVLGLLEDLALKKNDKGEAEDYAKFWEQFGRVLKEGPGEDFANKDKIASLLRFASTRMDTASQGMSLNDYVEKMQPEQKAIYYITADSFAAAKSSPHLEIFRKKGIEVLLLSDKVDEWLLGSLTEFDGKKLQSIAKGDLDLGALESDTEKEFQKKIEEEAKSLIERVKTTLGDAVKEVRVTHRLTDSPACLVAGEHDLSGNMARILKAAGQNAPESKPILELNPTHKLVKRLESETEQAKFADLAHLVFDQASLAEGGALNDPAAFVKRMNSLLV
jgi:molecular chaperone HtpG